MGNCEASTALADHDGVALAAMQGLKFVAEKDAQTADLVARVSALEADQTPNNPVSINSLVTWFLLTTTLVASTRTFGKRQTQKNA